MDGKTLSTPGKKKKTANTIQVYQVPKSLHLKCHLIIFDPFQTEKHEIPSKSHKGKPLNPLNIPWKPFKISWKTHENHLDPHQNHEKKRKTPHQHYKLSWPPYLFTVFFQESRSSAATYASLVDFFGAVTSDRYRWWPVGPRLGLGGFHGIITLVGYLFVFYIY